MDSRAGQLFRVGIASRASVVVGLVLLAAIPLAWHAIWLSGATKVSEAAAHVSDTGVTGSVGEGAYLGRSAETGGAAGAAWSSAAAADALSGSVGARRAALDHAAAATISAASGVPGTTGSAGAASSKALAHAAAPPAHALAVGPKSPLHVSLPSARRIAESAPLREDSIRADVSRYNREHPMPSSGVRPASTADVPPSSALELFHLYRN